MYSVPYSNDDSFKSLRLPKNPPSTLSANAPEFVFPQHLMQQQQQFQQQMPSNQQLDQPQPPPPPPQQQQQAHYQQQYPNSHNGYQHRNSNYQSHHLNHHHHNNHHHNNHHHNNHHHQRQVQSQPQHYHQQQHHQHQQHHMGAMASDVQDRLKISGPSGRQQPHNYMNQGQHHQHRSNSSYPSQQSRLKFNNFASTSGASTSAAAVANDSASNTPDMENVALDYLSTVIQCLNSNPGQYDTIATRFLNIFEGLENNQFVLSIAMEDIFNESIQNPNFRYMGAKLYHLLHMLNLKKDSLFLTLLKYKLDDFQREVRENMEQAQHGKVREATLFLAELYMQLRGDDSRIRLLAENIVFAMKQLLGKESPDNVRCICLTLKLAGFDLTTDCPEDIREIINCLAGINEKSPNKYPIIGSVLALSKDNWGRKLSSSVSFSESDGMPEPLRSSDEPIFYGPDGRELTAEETDFLSGDLASGPGGSTDEDDEVDMEELDLEMDEEASKAYKEFCKQNASS